jgi:hypothetical protein
MDCTLCLLWFLRDWLLTIGAYYSLQPFTGFFSTLSPIFFFFFFWIRGNLISWKAHFVGPGERVKLRLSQTLTRDACPDSNSRPAVQISSFLSSRYAPEDLITNSLQLVSELVTTKFICRSHIYGCINTNETCIW